VRPQGVFAVNRFELAQRTVKLAGDLDGNRWALAELAAEAKAAAVPEWAEIMALAVRRQPRTTREWAQAAEFRHAIGVRVNLPYSFYAKAMRYADRLDAAALVELLQTFAAEKGASFELFGAELATLAGRVRPEPPMTLEQARAWAAAWKRAAKRYRGVR
jgi:hypothetical protein